MNRQATRNTEYEQTENTIEHAIRLDEDAFFAIALDPDDNIQLRAEMVEKYDEQFVNRIIGNVIQNMELYERMYARNATMQAEKEAPEAEKNNVLTLIRFNTLDSD